MARRTPHEPTGRRRHRGRGQGPTVRHLWMVLAALAPVGAFIRALSGGWQPEGDDATIVLRAREILHGEIPLQGMRSTAGAEANPNHHLGPLELHSLMPAGMIATGWAVALMCVAVAVLCSVAAVHWAHRFGRDPGVVVFGSGVLLVQAAIGPEALFRPFNPYFGLLPLYLALVLLIALFARTPGVGWPLVLTTGIIAQANLAYAPIGLGIAAIALAFSGWDRLRRRSTSPRRRSFSRSAIAAMRCTGRRRLRRMSAPPSRLTLSRGAIATVVIAVIVWAPVLVEPLRHRPGNLEQLAQVALSGEPAQGPMWAVRRLGLMVPLPGGFRPLGPNLIYEPMLGAGFWPWLVVGVLLVAVIPWGLARDRSRATIPAAVALLATALLIATLAQLPVDGLANHYLASVIPVAVFAWAALAWRALLHFRDLPRHFSRLVASRIAVAASIIAMGLAFQTTPPNFTGSDLGRQASGLVLSKVGEMPAGTHVVIGGRGFLASLSTAPAVALQLEKRDYRAHYLFPWPTSEDAERLATTAAPNNSIRIHLVGSDAEDKHPPDGSRYLGRAQTTSADSVAVYIEVPTED